MQARAPEGPDATIEQRDRRILRIARDGQCADHHAGQETIADRTGLARPFQKPRGERLRGDLRTETVQRDGKLAAPQTCHEAGLRHLFVQPLSDHAQQLVGTRVSDLNPDGVEVRDRKHENGH